MKQVKLWRKLFPTNVCFLMWSVKWSCKQTNKKTFFGKISFVGIFCVYNRGHLFYFCLYKLPSYFLILKKFLLGCFLFWAPTCFLVLLCYFLLSFPVKWKLNESFEYNKVWSLKINFATSEKCDGKVFLYTAIYGMLNFSDDM